MQKRFALLFVLLLITVMTAQAQDYDVEDGGEIAVGDFVEGELEVGLRVQYTLEVEEDAELNITLDGDTDMYLRVYEDGDDAPFAENDDRGDGTLNSALYNLEVSEGDELIVEVGSYNDEGEGEYLLAVREPAELVDQGSIGVGDQVDGSLDENSRSVYLLEVPGDTAVTITAEGADDDTDPVLRVYAEDYDLPLVNDNRSADDFTAEITFGMGEDTTTVLVEVGTFGDFGAGDFTLSVEEAELVSDEARALDGRSAEDVCDEAEALEDPARAQYFAPAEVLSGRPLH